MKHFDMDRQSPLGLEPAAALGALEVRFLMHLQMSYQVRALVERVRALVASER